MKNAGMIFCESCKQWFFFNKLYHELKRKKGFIGQKKGEELRKNKTTQSDSKIKTALQATYKWAINIMSSYFILATKIQQNISFKETNNEPIQQ